jgi:regulator of replication initiation timing
MLNWRRDPDYERRINALRSETEQIKKETEQLRRENARLKALNALTRQLCFPPESSSIPQTSTEPDCGTSSPR